MDEKIECVWTDGCFDLIHYGHLELLRFAKQLGKKLIVGVHSDATIEKNKRKPVTYMHEKANILKEIMWVDEVVTDAPYITSYELMKKYNCDLCVHGSDVVFDAEGNDTYHQIKKLEKFKCAPRTKGISSTDIIRSILDGKKRTIHISHEKNIKNWLRIIRDKKRKILKDDIVVYVSGCFDILNPLLIDYFKKIKNNGSYLIVGVYNDETVKEITNKFPILRTIERALSLLSLRIVDDVVLDSPININENFLENYKIDFIFYGDCENKLLKQEKLTNLNNNHTVKINPPYELTDDYIRDRIRIFE